MLFRSIVYDLSEKIPLEKNKKHNIEVIVDRLVVKPEITHIVLSVNRIFRFPQSKRLSLILGKKKARRKTGLRASMLALSLIHIFSLPF